jgi:uncharacterized protein (TIGR02284 family)
MTSPNGEDRSTLKHLFAACKDSERGYRNAAKGAEADELKSLLEGFAEQRAQDAADLQSALGRQGSHSESSGTISGALHQGWTSIKSAATGGNDKALLAECARAEDAAKTLSEQSLGRHLSAGVRELVARQLLGIQGASDRLRALDGAAS